MEDVSRVLGVSSWSLYQWAKRYGNDQGMVKRNRRPGDRSASEKLKAVIEFEGLEHLLGPVQAGRGVVLVWSHMGNWEVLAQLVKTLGPDAKGGPIFRRLENPLRDELTVKRRTQQGAVLVD